MIILLITFILLLCLNMPIAFVIGIAGVAYFITNGTIPISIAVQRVVAQTQSYSFLAVPFFIFAGSLMNETGITKNLLRLAQIITRKMWGGLAQINVLLSTMMGGISGSACADASMEARVLGLDMVRRGYPKGYSAVVTCLSSLITATIPPSVGLILFGFVGGVSIGRLFIAGIIPGLLMCVALMITVHFTAKKHGYEPPTHKYEPIDKKELRYTLKESIPALLFPVILLVGIRIGLFTPSEGGAFAVVYAIFIGKFVYKELTWQKFLISLKNACMDTGVILMIICLSGVFSYAITKEKVPVLISEAVMGITSNPALLQIIILILLFLLGMVLDSDVNTLLLTPIFLPIVEAAGIDPVHFGVMMATLLTVGVMTPPVGTACYIVCGILGCPIEEYIKYSIPFFAAVLIVFIILIFLPDVVLFLPNLVYGS
ncbi:TRAP transporter large permease [Treponema parvum]|uniref:TRAP transporter large permease n=1 Tax=Treponema parvum TaxID=138851 RepID=A0A975F3N4_9SPIR|nr:TRAP transporter large permease [Treponema parvum]QTQ13683.1 TRAP transporter large permease [Treponema parvum]